MFQVSTEISKVCGFSVMKNYGYVFGISTFWQIFYNGLLFYAMLTFQFASVYS